MSSIGTESDETNKCQHELCSCPTSDSDKYCSPYCESAAKGITTVNANAGIRDALIKNKRIISTTRTPEASLRARRGVLAFELL